MGNTEVSNFIDKLHSGFRRLPSGNVIIHPAPSVGFIEYNSKFYEEVITDIEHQIWMASNEIEPLTPSTKMLIDILFNAY